MEALGHERFERGSMVSDVVEDVLHGAPKGRKGGVKRLRATCPRYFRSAQSSSDSANGRQIEQFDPQCLRAP